MAKAAKSENEDSKTVKKTIFAVATIALAVVILVYTNWPERTYKANQRYFSDDDGKSWFEDDINQIPPFKRNGKDVVSSVIYSYANGSKTFCGYLMRFPDGVKKSIEKTVAAGATQTPPLTASTVAYGTAEVSMQMEVKAPMKDSPWVPMTSQEARPILNIKSPDGSELDQVVP